MSRLETHRPMLCQHPTRVHRLETKVRKEIIRRRIPILWAGLEQVCQPRGINRGDLAAFIPLRPASFFPSSSSSPGSVCLEEDTVSMCQYYSEELVFFWWSPGWEGGKLPDIIFVLFGGRRCLMRWKAFWGLSVQMWRVLNSMRLRQFQSQHGKLLNCWTICWTLSTRY